MTRRKIASISILTAFALAIAPVTPASAHEYRHHHGFPILGGLFAAGVAVGGAAVAIATAPIRIVADAVQPYPEPSRAVAPVYYAPAPPYQQNAYQQPVYQQPAYGYAPYGYTVYSPAPIVYQQPVYGYYR